MRVLTITVMFVLVMVVASCTTKEGSPTIYGAESYVPEAEREVLKQKALAGDGRAAFRLANYEGMFGDIREAIRWYKESCRLGYEKEHCLGAYTSLEKHLEKGVFDRSTEAGGGSEESNP